MAITEDQLTQARTKAESAGQSAITFAAGSSEIEKELQDALTGALNNSGISEKRNAALADYQAAPAESRQTYGDPGSESFIFNPYARDALISRNIAQAGIPYNTLSDYYNLEKQSIPQILNARTNAYNAKANAMGQTANLARTSFSDLLSQYQLEQDQAYRNAQLELEKQKLAASQNSGGGINDIIASLFGGGATQPTEPEPQYSPSSNGELSQGGQWQFQDTKWVPTQSSNGGGFDVSSLDMNDPRTQLGLMALSQANTPSEILAATNVLFPADSVTSKSKAAEKATAYDNAKRQIEEALAILNKGGNVSGWSPFENIRKSGIGPALSEDKIKLQRLLADLAGPQAFGEAGKALTDVEKALVQGKIPESKFDEKFLIAQLNSILDEINAKQNDLDPGLSAIYGY